MTYGWRMPVVSMRAQAALLPSSDIVVIRWHIGEEPLHGIVGRAGTALYEPGDRLKPFAKGRADLRHIGNGQRMDLKHQKITDQCGICGPHRRQYTIRCLVRTSVSTVTEGRKNQSEYTHSNQIATEGFFGIRDASVQQKGYLYRRCLAALWRAGVSGCHSVKLPGLA
jgi:hypothetical protein